MQKINKPANKKSLTKVKEEWFQEGLVFRQIIDYNKVKGVSMWSKDQKQYLDNLEARLSNKVDQVNQKVDQVETRLNNKIEEVESRLNNKIEEVETRLNNKIEQNSLAIKAVQSSVDEVLTIIKNINQRLN